MDINKLNKEVPKENKDDKGSAEGDTVTEGDVSEDDQGQKNAPGLANLDLDEDEGLGDEEDESVGQMIKTISERVKQISIRKESKKSKEAAEDSSEVEGSDKCGSDEEENLA